ncbi:hypothetical protein BsWGS_22239 [Bradybaena similaris]
MELSPGIKLFFQLGNFFIMDSETLEVNSFQETHQTVISEVLKKNSLMERVTSIKNRVCENQVKIAKTRLDNQRARRLRQLLDNCNTLRHEATLLHLERQRQAMEVKQRLQPDAPWKYEGIRLRSRERHMAANIGPCYLDKRQQFPVRLRSTKDNSLTPTVRRARAALQQHQLEDLKKDNLYTSSRASQHGKKDNPYTSSRASQHGKKDNPYTSSRASQHGKKDNPYTSSRNSQHGPKSAPAPLAGTRTGLQEGTIMFPPLSAVSVHATRSQHSFCTPTARPYAASSIVNPATPPPYNYSHSSNYNLAQFSLNNHRQYSLNNHTQSSLNNHTQYSLDNHRKTSLSFYTAHFLDKHPHSSLPNNISSNHTLTHSSFPNHTSSTRSHAQEFLSNRISSLSNPITHSDNHTSYSSDKNTQRRRSRDIKSNCRDSTNDMHCKTPSSARESGTPDGNTHSRKANSPELVAGKLGFPHEGDDDSDYSLPDGVDLHSHFCGAQKNKDLPIGNSPSGQQSRVNQLLWGFRQQRESSPRLKGTAATETTDIQVKVATFLRNLTTLQKESNTVKERQVPPTSPTEAETLNPNINTTINPTKNDAQNDRELESSVTPGLINQNTSEVTDSVPQPGRRDQNAAEIKPSKLVNTTPRKTKYSWRDIPVPARDGQPGVGFSAEDLVLQALTRIPIRNVFQTPVPLNSAARAMRHTATYKMRQLVERMIRGRSRYERHLVEQLRHQMALELQGRAIAEEELASLTAGEQPTEEPSLPA